jgi:predicted ATPase
MQSAVEVRLFGAPHVVDARRATRLARGRPVQLLVFLVAHGGWVARDQLADLLFAGRDVTAARNNLRKVLHEARRFAWAAGVDVQGDRIRWNAATDVAAFERALAERRMGDAVTLYTGAFLLGLDDRECPAFTAWLEFERNRLAERWRRAALEWLPQLDEAHRLALAERLLDADPCDDAAARAKLAALRALGDEAGLLRFYRDYAQRLAADLGIEPSAAARVLARPPAPQPTAAADGRGPSSGLIGRTAEAGEALALLEETDARLVTITGVGGVGKTRLARHVFELLQRQVQFAERSWWIALEDLNQADQVAARIAEVLGLTLRDGLEPRRQVASFVGERTALLVLDNCEHLVGGRAALTELLQYLLTACPQLRLLITSRTRLNLRRESLLVLQGLAHADEGIDALDAPAAKLFVERARHALPAFDAETERAAIGDICRLVEGLPLALELAAAWVHLLPCAEIAQDLHSRLDVTEAVASGRGLRAAFERSWLLAAPVERSVLAALSVLAGTFARDAARMVGAGSQAVVDALIDKSLVRREAEADRYSLHPLLRTFAQEKLAVAGRALSDAKVRHAEYFRQFLARYRAFESVDQKRALAEVGRELENVRAAWCFACESGDSGFVAATAVALQKYFEHKGRRDEGLAWFDAAEEALATAGRAAAAARCEIGCAKATLLFRAGEYARGAELARRTLGLARSLRRCGTFKSSLNVLGLCEWQQDRPDEATRHLRAALHLAERDGDDRGISTFSMNLGMVERIRGNEAVAEAMYRRALENDRRRGDLRAAVSALNNLGNLQRTLGRLEQAVASLDEGVSVCEACGFDAALPALLLNLRVGVRGPRGRRRSPCGTRTGTGDHGRGR